MKTKNEKAKYQLKNSILVKGNSKVIDNILKISSKKSNIVKIENLKELTQKEFQLEKKKNLDVFNCFLCKNLFSQPIVCYKCEIIFCKVCIEQFLGMHTKCPNCFNIIFFDRMSLLDLSKNDFLSNQINCASRRCKSTVRVLDSEEHLKNCEFKNINLTNEKYLNKTILLNKHTDDFINNQRLFLHKIQYESVLTDFEDNNLNNLSRFKEFKYLVNQRLSEISSDLKSLTKQTNESLKIILSKIK